MSKHILVCLPISAEQKTRIEAVQGFAYRFTTPDTATVEDALWADAVLGNLPVPLIRQNDHLEWFQSNAAAPNNYLELVCAGGVHRDQRHRRLRSGHQRVYAGNVAQPAQGSCPPTGTTSGSTAGHPPATLWAALRAVGCCAWAWAISARSLPGGRMRWVPRWWACVALCTRTLPAGLLHPCGGAERTGRRSCRRPTLWR